MYNFNIYYWVMTAEYGRYYERYPRALPLHLRCGVYIFHTF